MTADKPASKTLCEALYSIATKFPADKSKPGRRDILVKYVLDGKISTEAQLAGEWTGPRPRDVGLH